MKKTIAIAALVLAVAGTASASRANIITTNTTLDALLVPGTELDVGVLKLTDWTYVGTAGGGAVPIAPGSIAVLLDATPGLEGVEFSSGWGVSGPVGIFEDSRIGFTASVNGGLITDLHLGMGGVVAIQGGQVSVGETYTPDVGSGGVLNVVYPPAGFLTDAIDVNPAADSVAVIKDIQVKVTSGDFGVASVSSVTNNFSHGVPEPASLSILGLGLAGLGLRKVRRQK